MDTNNYWFKLEKDIDFSNMSDEEFNDYIYNNTNKIMSALSSHNWFDLEKITNCGNLVTYYDYIDNINKLSSERIFKLGELYGILTTANNILYKKFNKGLFNISKIEWVIKTLKVSLMDINRIIYLSLNHNNLKNKYYDYTVGDVIKELKMSKKLFYTLVFELDRSNLLFVTRLPFVFTKNNLFKSSNKFNMVISSSDSGIEYYDLLMRKFPNMFDNGLFGFKYDINTSILYDDNINMEEIIKIKKGL